MWKKNIIKFHNKYPFAESTLLFVLGILIGFICNIFTDDVSSNRDTVSWRWIDSPFLWIGLSLMAFGIVYYIFFSSYSVGKAIQLQTNVEEKLKAALVAEGVKKIKSPDIEYEAKLELFDLTIKTIQDPGKNR
jgi:hypothetical protein